MLTCAPDHGDVAQDKAQRNTTHSAQHKTSITYNTLHKHLLTCAPYDRYVAQDAVLAAVVPAHVVAVVLMQPY